MESHNYEKVDLPIWDDKIKPGNPNFKWLFSTLWAILGIFLIAYISFSVFAHFVVANIDLETEKDLFWEFSLKSEWYESFDITKYSIKIPEFEKYDYYLIDDFGQPNAFASFGWQIWVTQELLDTISTEEELFFILSHEVGHVEHRHVLKRLAKDIPMDLTLSFLGLNFDLGFSSSSSLLMNSHSRSAEHESDDYAIALFKKYWLNTACATDFFESSLEMPTILSTHPSNQERIDKITAAWDIKGECKKIER